MLLYPLLAFKIPFFSFDLSTDSSRLVKMEGRKKIEWCTFRSRVKEYVQSADKLSLIGLTFHAGESYWGIHPYNYHIDDFTPLLPWNISKSSGIDWMEIELVNILFSLLQLSTWRQCLYILPKFWFSISVRTDPKPLFIDNTVEMFITEWMHNAAFTVQLLYLEFHVYHFFLPPSVVTSMWMLAQSSSNNKEQLSTALCCCWGDTMGNIQK